MRRFLFSLEASRLITGELRWVRLDDVWAQIVPLRARLSLHAGMSEQIVTHEIHLRYRDDIRAGHRLRRQNRILDIHSVEDVGQRKRRITCLCEEHVLAAHPQSEES